MSRDSTSEFWDALIGLNKMADDLIERVLKDREPSQPISREIPFYASVEARFDRLPNTFASAVNPGSDLISASNLKIAHWENNGPRVYVREINFQPVFISHVTGTDDIGNPIDYEARSPDDISRFPFNWRWNFQTSITEKWYSRNGRCLARSAGRFQAGNHLAFRKPLIIEPRETFRFECELLSFGMTTAAQPVAATATACVVALIMSGYREGI